MYDFLHYFSDYQFFSIARQRLLFASIILPLFSHSPLSYLGCQYIQNVSFQTWFSSMRNMDRIVMAESLKVNIEPWIASKLPHPQMLLNFVWLAFVFLNSNDVEARLPKG